MAPLAWSFRDTINLLFGTPMTRQLQSQDGGKRLTPVLVPRPLPTIVHFVLTH
jgi:hypothetical protein